MKFGCPYCHTFCERNDVSGGDIVSCPSCGKKIQIRAPSLSPISFQEPPRPKRNAWVFVAIVVVAVLGLMLVRDLSRYRHEKEMAERQLQLAEIERDKEVGVAALGFGEGLFGFFGLLMSEDY